MNMLLPRFCAIRRGGAVLVGALLMTWPALYNRYPLLYPDSMSYLEDGRLVTWALFLHKFSADYGGRSFIYCLGIVPFHWNVTAWPIVALNAFLTAYVIWLVVRSISPQQTVMRYLALTVALSVFTGLGWFVSIIMPDTRDASICSSIAKYPERTDPTQICFWRDFDAGQGWLATRKRNRSNDLDLIALILR